MKKDRYDAAEELCQNIKKLNPQRGDIIVGPETTYPFAPTEKLLRWWASALPKGSYLLFGSLRNKEKGGGIAPRRRVYKQYQTVYMLEGALPIIKIYDKRHRVPFGERIPRIWKYWSKSRDVFIGDKYPIARGCPSQQKTFSFQGTVIRPLICSELFFLSKKEILPESGPRPHILLVFLNDSWFCDRFCRILALSARFQAARFGIPIVYVGHNRAFNGNLTA